MTLPNYSPQGIIRFGSVPWDNSYTNVRLYTSLSQQRDDILSLMKLSSDNYTYIGRNRRIKVSIPADKLYHCNYCMYLNESLTDGYIYCFITDVLYINDNTTEIEIETDVFQTYLYGVDWSIPACFIERETVPSESEKYLLTNEPDFPLIYEVDGISQYRFDVGGFIIMSSAAPKENETLIDAVLNPEGYYTESSEFGIYKGHVNGAQFFYVNRNENRAIPKLYDFLNGLNKAGSIESAVAIFTIPTFLANELDTIIEEYGDGRDDPSIEYPGIFESGFIDTSPYLGTQEGYYPPNPESFNAPDRGSSLDGYTPHNRKLLYYPYTFCRLTDFNGSQSDLRYEQLSNNKIIIRSIISPTCQAVVYPEAYMGAIGLDVGLTVNCGAQGNWSSNQFQTWLAQNIGTIALTLGSIAVGGAVGRVALSSATRLLSSASKVKKLGGSAALVAKREAAAEQALSTAKTATLSAVGGGALLGQQMLNASNQPTVTKGQADYSLLHGLGIQGVAAERIVVKSEIAEQIDEFFDRFGYAVERIESVNITSRPSWNYVKTGGAAPKSTNVAPGNTAPFDRGRGTPADALDIIRSSFDDGITFWHTTDGFGNYGLDNSL